MEVAARALTLNVLVNVSFGAPIAVAYRWLEENELTNSLVDAEREILQAKAEPSTNDKNLLRWKIESLWSAAGAGGFFDDLMPVQEISNSLVLCFPCLRTSESPEKFYSNFKLRRLDELYEKLDIFYRAHWHTRNCQLSGNDSSPFHPGVVQQRRHFLEWVLHGDTKWDDIDLST